MNINPSISNMLRWVAGTTGQLNHRPSVWCSKYYFFFIISWKILCKKPFNSFYYFFYKITKLKIKSFECPKSIKSIRKIILGTSDSWSTIRLSHCNATQRNILLIDGYLVSNIWQKKTDVLFVYCKVANINALWEILDKTGQVNNFDQ